MNSRFVRKVIADGKPDELKDLLEDFAILTDQLGIDSMKMLEHLELYAYENRLRSPSELTRLHQLESLDLVRSKMVLRGNSLVRRFVITNLGRKVAAALKIAAIYECD